MENKCAKRVFMIKPPRGSIFEQAIFVLRDGCEPSVTRDRVVAEALKIAKYHGGFRRCAKILPYFLAMIAGAAAGSAALYFLT